MLLRHTQDAIAELAINRRQPVGDHAAHETTLGGDGMVVGLEAFDLLTNDVTDIQPVSLEEEMTGQPQVEEVYPFYPLGINIVAHSDPVESHDPPEILRGRRFLMRRLFEDVKDSVLEGDNTKVYVTGSADPYLLDRDSEFIGDTEGSAAAAAAIAEICQSGLTLVLSTFKHLSLEKQSKVNGRMAVGIKANHLYDRRLGRNLGTWDTNDPEMPVVNTNDGRRGKVSRQLQEYWDIQDRRHTATVRALETAGVRMADTVFDKQHPRGYDADSTDRSLAVAIKRLGKPASNKH